MRNIHFLYFISFISFGNSLPITLEDLLTGKYIPRYFSGIWTSDADLAYNDGVNVMSYNVVDGGQTLLINGSIFNQTRFPGRTLTESTDKEFVLIKHSVRAGAFRDVYVKYDIYERSTGIIKPLLPKDYPVNGTQPEMKLARWSPANGSEIVFVYENNIYYKTSAFADEIIQITFDGTKTLANGQTDWPKSEERHGGDSGVWFSPSGNRLAFIKYDETLVDEYQYQTYGEPGDDDYIYPKLQSIRFPKAGTTNPTVQMYFVDLTSGNFEPQEANYTSYVLPENLHYISVAAWESDSRFVIVHFTRRQQNSTWFSCNIDAAGNLCEEIWGEGELSGWIESLPFTISEIPGSNTILTLSSALAPAPGATESFRHIIKLNSQAASRAQRIYPKIEINGIFVDMHVDTILGWDEDNKKIYFEGNTQLNVGEMHIFTVSDDSLAAPNVQCLTCGIVNGDAEPCQGNSVAFSKKFTYFLHLCRGPGIPETSFRATAEPKTPIFVVIDNAQLRKDLENVDIPTKAEFLNIPLSHGGIARARLYLPPNFDPTNKYPLFIEVYAGTGTQFLVYDFLLTWGSSLVSDKHIIHAHIDGSVSSRRSRDSTFKLSRRLGTVEVEDQLEAAKWLIQNTGYIDTNRTAIWGWSMGGHAAAMALAKDKENILKCGISQAPLTNPRFLHPISIENFMGFPTPEDNLLNYRAADVTLQVENFRNKKFLLVHGSADVNANYQHSMVLSRALVKANILFDQLTYTDREHIIGEEYHMYKNYERFLIDNCFAGREEIDGTVPPPPESSTPISTTDSTKGDSFRQIPATIMIFYMLIISLIYH